MISSAYVHVPFCSSICSYCAFSRSANTGLVQDWLQIIVPEITRTLYEEKQKDPQFVLKTLYFGGGTPGLLSSDQLARLAAPFQKYLAEEAEWTLETNPESMSEEKLAFWKKTGINRLSVGVQSFHDDSLKKLGRRHSAKEASEALQRARAVGFERISADLIYGLPWMSLEETEEDVKAFLRQNLGHLSIYSLQIEDNSVFGKQHLQPVDEDLEADEYEMICRILKENGFRHYEISSFCKSGEASRHNLTYWQDGNYFGFGWGAVGRLEHVMTRYEGSLQDYLDGKSTQIQEDDADRPFEALMMALRTDLGLDLEDWNRKYHQNFEEKYAAVLDRYSHELVLEKGRLHVTERGMEILNTILVAFLELD